MRQPDQKNKSLSHPLKYNSALHQENEQLKVQLYELTMQYQQLNMHHQRLYQDFIQLSAEIKTLQMDNLQLNESNCELGAENEGLIEKNEYLAKENGELTLQIVSPAIPLPLTSPLRWEQDDQEQKLDLFMPKIINIKKAQPETFEEQIFKLLTQGLKKAANLDPLKTHLEDEEESVEYFNQFIPYIFEETRAQISQQLEAISRKHLRPFRAFLREPLLDERDEDKLHITIYGQTTELPKLDHGFYLEAVLIVINEEEQWPRKSPREENINGLAAIASINNHKNERKAELSFKIRKADYRIYKNIFNKNRAIRIHWLSGLVPASRMYQVCVDKPETSFDTQFIRGRLEPWPMPISAGASSDDEKLGGLNPSQRNAVQKLQQAESGIYCLQGPPGTGKTTTLGDFLIQRVKIKPKERILACAPSNQAVRILLKAIKEKQPKLLIALVGTGKDISEEIADIYVHNYAYRLYNPLIKLKRYLENSPSFADLEELITDIEKKLAAIRNQLSALLESSPPMSIQPNIKQAVERLVKILNRKPASPAQAASPSSLILEKSAELKRSISEDLDEFSPVLPAAIILAPGQERKVTEQLINQLENTIDLLKQSAHDIESFLVQRAQIVFATLISSGRKWLKKQIAHFPVVVIDEAAQALVPEALIPLVFNPKLCIHVGDPSQLPATVISKTAQEGGYGNSIMSWLMVDCRQPFERLTIQYRMNPKICQWPSERFYEGELKTAPAILERKCILKKNLKLASFLKYPSLFLNIEGKEERHGPNQTASIYNDKEAIAVIKTFHYLLGCGFKATQIGIITFYTAQVTRIQFHHREMIKRRIISNEKKSEIDVRTVDGFQGGERDIMLLSVVRTAKSAGFLSDPRRINVAMTRAKYGRFVFGNETALRESNSEIQNFLSSSSVSKETESQLAKVIGKLSYP